MKYIQAGATRLFCILTLLLIFIIIWGFNLWYGFPFCFMKSFQQFGAGFCVWRVNIPPKKRKCTMKIAFMICDFHGNDDMQVFEIWFL